MTHLKELRIKNFKSFRKARVPFKKGFTTIIGPNGSGKSNLLDALLFSLGTTSMKMLRANRLTELVNNTATEKYGKVELVLRDNGGKDWEISRTIDKKGKCIYRLNGEKKGLNEISSLLTELKIKNNGHNIVAQGDVTRIIEMNPEQRRGIIDELAGILEFEMKKAEAQNELEKVNQKLKEANLILSDRMEYLKRLEEEKKAAMEFRELEERKKSAKATLLKEELAAAEEKMGKHGKKLGECSKAGEEFGEKLSELREKALKAESETEKLGEEIMKEQQQSMAKIAAELEEKKSAEAIIREKINSKENAVAEAGAREGRLSQRLSELKERKKTLSGELEGIGKELPIKSRLMEELGKELDAMDKTQTAEVKKLGEKEAELRVELKKAEALSEEAFSLESKRDLFKKENELIERNAKETKERIERLETDIKRFSEKETLLKILQAEKVHEQLSETEEKILKKLEKEKGLLAKKHEIEKSLGELKKEMAKCPVCDSDLPARKKAALREKKENEIKALEFEHSGIRPELKELMDKRASLAGKKAEIERLIPLAEAVKEKRNTVKALREKLTGLKSSFRDAGALGKKISDKRKALRELRERNERQSFELEKEKERVLSRENDLRERFLEAKSAAKMLEQQKEGIERETESGGKEKSSIVREIDLIENGKKGKEKEIDSLLEELEKVSLEIGKIESKKENAAKALGAKMEKREKSLEKTANLREKRQALEAKARAREKEAQDLRVEIGKLEVRLADLGEEFKEFSEVKLLHGLGGRELREEMPKIDRKIRELGTINLKALESFNEEKKELLEINKKVEKLEEERNAVLEMIGKIEIKRNNVFMECFVEIQKNFSKMFYSFFNGSGSLALTDDDNPTESGLIISAKHKGANLVNIDAMSGGEKSLTALAFLFAIQLYEPAPFYVFDEADAALDDENSLKMVKIIKEISKESQFIAITHNNSLIKEADLIVGITLDKNKSSVIGLDLKQKIMEKNH